MQEALVLKVELLKSLRQQRFLSQEDLFNACQQRSLRVSLATIKRAETGKKSVTERYGNYPHFTLCRLCLWCCRDQLTPASFSRSLSVTFQENVVFQPYILFWSGQIFVLIYCVLTGTVPAQFAG